MSDYQHFLAHVKKEENRILVKGLSFDGLDWYLMTESHQEIQKHHPQILKYVSRIEKIVDFRHPKVPITKAIRSTYLNEYNQFKFDNQILEKDDGSKDDSILTELSFSADKTSKF